MTESQFVASMIASVFGILCFALIGIVLYARNTVSDHPDAIPDRVPWQIAAAKACGLMVILLAMAIATSPLYFEYPTGREPLYERQADGSVMVKPVGAFCWENSDECFHGTNHPLKLVASVAVVTDNPKVRNIQLYMNLRVTDANLFYGKSPRMSRFCGNNQNVYHLAEDYGGRVWQNCFEPEIVRKGSYYTYELINFKSRELAEFYNPLEHDQQQSMAKLVKDYLNPKLEEWGLAVEHAWFNIKPE